MELELRGHIYKRIFSQVASLHVVNSQQSVVNYADYKGLQLETRAFPVPRSPYLANRLYIQWHTVHTLYSVNVEYVYRDYIPVDYVPVQQQENQDAIIPVISSSQVSHY